MQKIKQNLIDIKTSSTLAINELSRKLESEGKEIYKFGLGQSPFPVPDSLVEELKNNSHQKDYLNVSGLLELRQQVAKYHSEKNKFSYNAEDIIIGPGSKELIFQTQLVLDGILILQRPSWVSYEPQAKIVNKKIHWIDTNLESNWHIDPILLDRLCRNIKEETKVLILNSPNNPSGTKHPNLKELALVAKKNDLIVIADEIYAELDFAGKYESISHFYPEKTIISSGISKWCGAGGWRLGTLIFPKQLNLVKQIIRSVASETFTSVSSPIQYAAVKAYSDDFSVYLSNSRKILKFIGNYIYEKLNKEGIIVNKPQGSFYMLCDFSKKIKLTNEITNSPTLCQKILADIGFAMLPGKDFGIDEKKLITRIAFVDFEGKKALNYASKKEELSNDFLIECCPKIVTGIEKLISWVNKN